MSNPNVEMLKPENRTGDDDPDFWTVRFADGTKMSTYSDPQYDSSVRQACNDEWKNGTRVVAVEGVNAPLVHGRRPGEGD